MKKVERISNNYENEIEKTQNIKDANEENMTRDITMERVDELQRLIFRMDEKIKKYREYGGKYVECT